MTVEFRPVDAGEEGLAAHRHPAGAAHPRTVDHQCVERHGGFQPVFARGERHELHHHHRADGHALVVALAPRVDQLAEQLRHQPVEALRTVVRGDVEVARHGTHLVGVDQHVARLGAHDDIGPDTVLVQPLDLRIDRRRAYAAGDEKITPTAQRLGRQGYELRRVPQRTGEIGQRVAGFQRADLARRDADRLRHDRDRTGRAVVIGHRQRHPLALLVGTDDDELSGQRRSRHTRRLDPHPENPRREFRLFYDSKHILFLD